MLSAIFVNSKGVDLIETDKNRLFSFHMILPQGSPFLPMPTVRTAFLPFNWYSTFCVTLTISIGFPAFKSPSDCDITSAMLPVPVCLNFMKTAGNGFPCAIISDGGQD